MKVIAISGFAETGKNSFASILMPEIKYIIGELSTMTVEISDRIIRGVCDLLLMDAAVFGRPGGKNIHAYSPMLPEISLLINREVLQRYANKMRELFGDEFWVVAATHNIRSTLPQRRPSVLIVNGIRLDAEIIWLKSVFNDVIVVDVQRPGVGPTADRTEKGVTLVDVTVLNDGDRHKILQDALRIAKIVTAPPFKADAPAPA